MLPRGARAGHGPRPDTSPGSRGPRAADCGWSWRAGYVVLPATPTVGPTGNRCPRTDEAPVLDPDRRGTVRSAASLPIVRAMSGVLHPVGPESSETYWVRCALVVGVLLVLIIGLLIFLINLGGRPGQAAPATATAVPSTDAPAPTSSTDSPAPADSASTSPEPSSSTATSSASTSASQLP